jgi:hypothetical protein
MTRQGETLVLLFLSIEREGDWNLEVSREKVGVGYVLGLVGIRNQLNLQFLMSF